MHWPDDPDRYGWQAMSDVELRDQLMTLLVAGHDTTATALSWALERLTRHPDVLRKAVRAAHASAAGDPAGDEYLDAIGKEVLRIRPVVFDVGRVLNEPVDVAGYRLPAGVMVAPGIGLVHASAERYPDPERFDPDRMLGTSLPPTTWLPFGGGNRRCLGATFALAELRIVLREVLRRVELETTTAAGERQRVKGVTLIPHRGARITVTAIRAVAFDRRPRHRMPRMAQRISPARRRGAHSWRDQVDHPDGVAFGPLVGSDELRQYVPDSVAPQPCSEIVQFWWAEPVRRIQDLAEGRHLEQSADEVR